MVDPWTHDAVTSKICVVNVDGVSVDSNQSLKEVMEERKIFLDAKLGHRMIWAEFSMGWGQRGQCGAFQAPRRTMFLPMGRKPAICFAMKMFFIGGNIDVASDSDSQAIE